MLYLNKFDDYQKRAEARFNFNKCCIWMQRMVEAAFDSGHLTLTSVVFEWKTY